MVNLLDLKEILKWVIMQMNNGRYDDNKQLFSVAIHQQMWTPQTIIPAGQGAYNTHFAAYGLGWFMSDVKGYKEINHTGGITGMVTKITLIPELKLAIIVLTNQESGAAFNAITNQIKDSYLGITGKDWVKTYDDAAKRSKAGNNALIEKIWKQSDDSKKAGVKVDTAVLGTYHDNWLGDAVITYDDGKFIFRAKRSPKLTGEMLPYKANTYIVKWNIRSMDADAFITFSFDENGKPSGFKMKPISPATDFSFDFQDLDFHR